MVHKSSDMKSTYRTIKWKHSLIIMEHELDWFHPDKGWEYVKHVQNYLEDPENASN